MTSHNEPEEHENSSPDRASPDLIISDTNVVVKMYIFKSSIMFGAKYTKGVIRIHPSVIEELERWLKDKRQKWRKFGEDMLRGIIAAAKQNTGDLRSPDLSTLASKHKILQMIEGTIPDEEKGQDTSETDRELLISTDVNGACLATNDKALAKLALLVLGEDRVLTFGNLVKDLFDQKLLTTQEIRDGIDSLISFKERPDPSDRVILNCLLTGGDSEGKS